MREFATLREIVDSKMEFDAVYLKEAHPDVAGEMWGLLSCNYLN